MKFYVDTSVWGGYFDKEFSAWTIPFIDQLKQEEFTAVVSDVTIKELQDAPSHVRELIAKVPATSIELVEITKQQEELAELYIKEGALTKKYETDAQHIAVSTILKVDSLVSWNFKHMVNFFRIRQYNAINLKHGYSNIDIRTPKELTYEKE